MLFQYINNHEFSIVLCIPSYNKYLLNIKRIPISVSGILLGIQKVNKVEKNMFLTSLNLYCGGGNEETSKYIVRNYTEKQIRKVK